MNLIEIPRQRQGWLLDPRCRDFAGQPPSARDQLKLQGATQAYESLER